MAMALGVAGVVVLIVPRVFPSIVGVRLANLLHTAVEKISFDDEMPALSIPLVAAMTWPADDLPSKAIMQRVLAEEEAPNDLLVFAVASAVAKRISPNDAREVFLGEVEGLVLGGRERWYLAVALLPLGVRGGLCSEAVDSCSLLGAYRAVDWPLQSGSQASDKDVAFDRFLDLCSTEDMMP